MRHDQPSLTYADVLSRIVYEHGVSVDRLADAADISPAAIYEWMKGVNGGPKLTHARAWCRMPGFPDAAKSLIAHYLDATPSDAFRPSDLDADRDGDLDGHDAELHLTDALETLLKRLRKQQGNVNRAPTPSEQLDTRDDCEAVGLAMQKYLAVLDLTAGRVGGRLPIAKPRNNGVQLNGVRR